MTILVGCRGRSYDDWVDGFYPIELANKKGAWFDYYAQYFRTVEINSTFYRPPGEFQVNAWIKKGKDKKGFEYSLKVPQLVTHKALVEGDKEKAIFWATSFEKTCVKPLAEAGLLGGVLFQLSPFYRNEGPALENLKGVFDVVSHQEFDYAVSHQEFDYAVEFRHDSWLDASRKEIDAEALEILRERNVAKVLIDGPGLHLGSGQTANHSYLRFHGRNYDIWYKEEKEDDHRLDRYDFLYKKDQLDSWVPQIREAELKVTKVRIYFNNHARAKSVRNAFLLMDMLLIEHKEKESSLWTNSR
jgi:uncharacterized protein YecE (DUF72 family)